MTKYSALLLAAAIGLPLALPVSAALAGTGDEQGELRRDVRAGSVKKPSEIEARVLPMMRGMQYLGPEYDPVAMAYRLKFIRDGRVVFVDVDARTGQIIRQMR